jgi:hypothetical protein
LIATANGFWTAYRNKHPLNGENAIVPTLPWPIIGTISMLIGLSGIFSIWIALAASLGYGVLAVVVTLRIDK